MAVIQDYMNGACHITVYDDRIRPSEEVKKIIDNMSMLVYSEELRKHMAEMEERKQTEPWRRENKQQSACRRN